MVLFGFLLTCYFDFCSFFSFSCFFFFFFNDTATTEIYTLSLHDALPISRPWTVLPARAGPRAPIRHRRRRDRKSTRLNSSHITISYAVFCLKKKKKKKNQNTQSQKKN